MGNENLGAVDQAVHVGEDFLPVIVVGKPQQMWTNFARSGNPSTDKVEWKAFAAQDQNVLVIAGPENIHHVEKGLLTDQYKAVLPLLRK